MNLLTIPVSVPTTKRLEQLYKLALDRDPSLIKVTQQKWLEDYFAESVELDLQRELESIPINTLPDEHDFNEGRGIDRYFDEDLKFQGDPATQDTQY